MADKQRTGQIVLLASTAVTRGAGPKSGTFRFVWSNSCMFCFLPLFFARSSSIGKTPEYTVRRKGVGHWSAGDPRVNHCNSVLKCVIRFNTLGAVCMVGRMCHHASKCSHRDAHGTVVSTEHTETRQVGRSKTEHKRVRGVRHVRFLVLRNPWLNR